MSKPVVVSGSGCPRSRVGPTERGNENCSGEREAKAVAFVACEAIGLKAQDSADYIQLYPGDNDMPAESLEYAQRAGAEILAAITGNA